jgi:hypothetical protein
MAVRLLHIACGLYFAREYEGVIEAAKRLILSYPDFRLIGEGRMPPVVVAFPDCFTRLGGNQYINSASMGAWADFLLHEMLPAIEQRVGCGGIGRIRAIWGSNRAIWVATAGYAPQRPLPTPPNNRAVGCERLVIRFGVPEGKSEVTHLSQSRLLNATGSVWLNL